MHRRGLYDPIEKEPVWCAVYNEQLEMVERMEDEGQIIVIRPLKPVAVDRIEKDVQKLTEFYQEGYECLSNLSDTPGYG